MEPSKVTLEDLTPVRKRLEVEVPAAQVQAEIDQAFQTVGRKARLRGFRPGKAPRRVLEQVFGEQVRREVLGRLVEESFHHAVEHHGLAVVGSPEIEAETLKPGEALRFSAMVDVRPAIALGDLAGLEGQRPIPTVGDPDVDRVLAAMRESVAQLRPIEDRTVIEAGDVVTVDLVTRLEGGETSRREGVLVEAGAGGFPLALERQLVGQPLGTHLTVRVPYPSDYENAGLAGKTAEFDVGIKALRAKELPPLDDDFARDHGKAESLGGLRARIRADLERHAEERADAQARESVLQQLIGRHPFDVPPSMVTRRCDALLASLDVRLPEGPGREAALERLRAEVRPRAEQEVRAELLLDAVAAREDITVSDDAVSAEIGAIAARERQVPERIRAFYDRPEARAALHARLVRERALAQLMTHARIVPTEASQDVAREK